jgi:hypothetical protein
MAICAHHGFLVDGDGPIPEDPTDLGVEGLPIVGCSRLVCGSCGAAVTHVVARGSREYHCRCATWTEASQRALRDGDPDPHTDPPGSWACAGHPEITLPQVVDGEDIADDAALREVVARALAGWMPPGARPSDEVWGAWLRRLSVRLAPVHARALGDVAVEHLTDPDALTRARAIATLRTAQDPALLGALLGFVEEPHPRFAGVPDEISSVADETLEDSLWRALAPLVASGRARALARTAATSVGRGSRALYDVLATHDAKWFVAQTPAMAKANREGVEVLCQAYANFAEGAVIRSGRERARAAAADLVPRARTVQEMLFAASLVPCPGCGGADAKLALYGHDDGWVLSGPCSGCGAPRSFQFATEGNPRSGAYERLQLGDGRPSEVITAEQFAAELERLEPGLRDDVSNVPITDWHGQKAVAERAYTAAVELAKFPGADRAARARATERLDAFAADAPRVWAAKGPLDASEELRGVLNQAGLRRRPTAEDLRAYLETRAGSTVLTGWSVREDGDGVEVELEVELTDDDVAEARLGMPVAAAIEVRGGLVGGQGAVLAEFIFYDV